MRKTFLGLLLFVLSPEIMYSQRVVESFDENWQFHKGDIAIKLAVKAGMQGGLSDANVKREEGEEVLIAYTDRNKVAEYKPSDWKDVNLPHDWLVEESVVHDDNIGSQPAANGYHPTDIGFYRKEFEIDGGDEGKKISIDFDGIFRNSTVWVNGHLMGNHKSGYLPSSYDITDVLRYGKEGKNVILVKVDATDYEGWWYEGCGIYRHVWLTKTQRLHVARFGTFVTTPSVSLANATVNIQTTLQNEFKTAQSVDLISTITDMAGNIYDTQSCTLQIGSLCMKDIQQRCNIVHPVFWSPETPHLYKVQTKVMVDGKVADTYNTTFGVRTVQLTADGFYLNGKLYPIKGTANHQDFAGVGVALPDKINEYKIGLLKDMGSNGYRSAHHPPTPELLDICDSLGMLVLDENRHLNSSEDGISDLTTLIMRDRNHPCVFMWSLENEENLEGNMMGTRILQTLAEVAHKLDSTRQVTAAINHDWNNGGYSDVLDVVGYNYGQRGMQYVKDKQNFPNRKMLVTESTSFVSTRGEHEDNPQKGYMSNFGKGVSWGLQPGEDWKHIVDYPYLSGTFVWTGFDYRGEPTPYRWPCVSSHFGIMDLCGFPKDGYYAYKAAWKAEPLVHAFPHWNLQGKEGDTIRMGVYTNCEKVEMLVNGKSLGIKKAEPMIRLEWQVAYKPGKVEVRGYKAGKMVTKEITETTGSPRKLTMKSDVNELRADGTDVAIINIAIRDAKGRVVPTACDKVVFTIDGPGTIIGCGNGDPSCHDSEKANWHKAFNGYCQLLVQTQKTSGNISVKANAENLKGAEVILNVK